MMRGLDPDSPEDDIVEDSNELESPSSGEYRPSYGSGREHGREY